MGYSTQDIPDLSGKTVLITGGNSGIGFEAARVFARHGADLFIACRSAERGRRAEQALRAESPHARVEVIELDLSSLAAIRRCAEQFRAKRSQLQLLINNAGLMAIPRQLTADGFEMQFGVNHLGHFALTGWLLPLLLATPEARVVTVSSRASELGRMRFDDLDGATHYEKWRAYFQSKLANLLFSFELAQRLQAKGSALRSVACHPGYAATNLQFVGPQLEGSRLGHALMSLGNRLIAQSAADGALPTLFAATAPAAISGTFVGPDGLFERAGAPHLTRANRRAYDRAAMQQLWTISSQRTGVAYAELE
jgi:NAD(P)-dependent dehydrogenase (short-subunit alcohol dehydrogenase family)